jgi:hypothetical protein
MLLISYLLLAIAVLSPHSDLFYVLVLAFLRDEHRPSCVLLCIVCFRCPRRLLHCGG